MSVLEARDLLVERGGRRVLELDRFAVDHGETVAVVGPNGAGKSTLLLTLAMLLAPSRGTLKLHGRVLTGRSALALRRSIALVLPNPLLLDTTAGKNVATGLAFRGIRGPAADRRVDEWLDRFGILALRDRRARELSSGEAQRVALARAFVLDPQLLLLDEPFSSVDVEARAKLVEDTARLLRATSRSCVVVTHDLDEACRLGTRMAVIVGGRCRQDAPVAEVLAKPADAEVAAFVGLKSRIPGRVVASHDGLAVVDAGAFRFDALSPLPVGTRVLACLRPGDLTLRMPDAGAPTGPRSEGRASRPVGWGAEGSGTAAPTGSARNRLRGTITDMSSGASVVHVTVDVGLPVVAEVTRASAQEMRLGWGVDVEVVFKATAVHLMAVPG